MFLTDVRRWLNQLSRNTSRNRHGRSRVGAARRLPVRLRCEQLEDRLVPAALQPNSFAKLTDLCGLGSVLVDVAEASGAA